MGYWDEKPESASKHSDYSFNEYEHAQKVILARRLAEEKAHYERGFPVAGHDFARLARERNSPGLER